MIFLYNPKVISSKNKPSKNNYICQILQTNTDVVMQLELAFITF